MAGRCRAPCLQIHGVKKHDLKSVIAAIANAGGSTLGGCGDINRNIMTPPAPLADPAYQYAFQTSNFIADLFAPESPAFMEVGAPFVYPSVSNAAQLHQDSSPLPPPSWHPLLQNVCRLVSLARDTDVATLAFH